MVRIATHPRIYAAPSRLEDALSFARVLLERAAHLHGGAARRPSLLDLRGSLRKAKANGNLVQDAWLAALVIEAGCEWITTDGDFARFAGLRWRRPI